MKESSEHKKRKESDDEFSPALTWVIAIAAVLILFNQIQLFQLGSMLGSSPLSLGPSSTMVSTLSRGDLDKVDINKIQGTPQAIAATFDFSGVKDAQGVINVMIPKGQPDYGKDISISYDDPVTALNFLGQKLYPAIKQDVKTNDPETWQRYIAFGLKPIGVSCEFCCGVGPVGITKEGELACGCQHNPAIQAIALYLMKNTKMSDAEILREVMRWKALWFPRNMVEIGLKISGGDASVLANVPTQVGGC